MTGVNLYEYVESGLFLSEIKTQFDVIITDNIRDKRDTSLLILDMSIYGFDCRLGSEIDNEIQQYKQVLFVLKDLSSHHVIDLIMALRNRGIHVVVINCGVGVDSVLYKDELDVKDLAIMTPLLPCYEPVSLEQFNSLLSGIDSLYMRLTHQFVLENHENYMSASSGLLDMRHMGFQGDDVTLVLGGSYISYAQSIYHACEDESVGCDVFALSSYSFEEFGLVESSATDTQKVFVVVDHELPSLKNVFDDFLTAVSGSQIHFIVPNYNTIQTRMEEFVHQMAGFDAIDIAEKIVDSL